MRPRATRPPTSLRCVAANWRPWRSTLPEPTGVAVVLAAGGLGVPPPPTGCRRARDTVATAQQGDDVLSNSLSMESSDSEAEQSRC